MKKLAIDIVLLPPDEIMDLAIEQNRKLIVEGKEKIVLDKEKCLPHISLAMGVIDYVNLPTIGQNLDKIAKETKSINLQIQDTTIEKIPTNELCPYFLIHANDQIQELHEKIINKNLELLKWNAKNKMFFTPPEVEVADIWVNSYLNESSYENYNPHITLGIGDLKDELSYPIEFTATRLALCHLGNYCTCRKILYEKELRG
ncbi:MAG: hypothetical protein ABIE68_04660 [bacterium]